jgi:hypothetical protein
MWDAHWMPDVYKGHDGMALCVRLPNLHDWLIDGPSYDGRDRGPGWTRTGIPPRVTARPSIFSNQGAPYPWHGFLTDGVLEEC